MSVRKYFYTDVDGEHLPDADKGDNLYYGIDAFQWLNAERDTLVSAVWTVPPGVTSSDPYLDGTTALVKLTTNKVGVFKVVCTLTSTDNGKEQTNAIPLMIKVR